MRRTLVARVLGLPLLGIPAFLGTPQTAAAQQSGATLQGIVIDSAGTPIEGAEVILYGIRRKALTSGDGVFRFTGLDNIKVWVLARGIGYFPQQVSVSLQKNETRVLPITLHHAPALLPDVVVEAKSDRYEFRMRDFMWRSRIAWGGRFLTRDDITRANPAALGDLVLRHMPFKLRETMDEQGGWLIDPRLRARGPYSYARFTSSRYFPECPPAISVNGNGITPLAVNDFHVDDVEALEIYREGINLPIEFSYGGRTACGLVVVWTRWYVEAGDEG